MGWEDFHPYFMDVKINSCHSPIRMVCMTFHRPMERVVTTAHNYIHVKRVASKERIESRQGRVSSLNLVKSLNVQHFSNMARDRSF